MNHCYFCEKLVDRVPYDGKQHVCETCKAKGQRLPALSPDSLPLFWIMNPAEQKNINKVVNPRCDECGKRVDQPVKCWYCDYVICPSCTRAETFGDEPIKVCISCHEAGKQLDAVIGQKGE